MNFITLNALCKLHILILIIQIRCVTHKNEDKTFIIEENEQDQRDDRYSRGYKLKEMNITSDINEFEDCDNGYFFDKKSRQCIGNCYLLLYWWWYHYHVSLLNLNCLIIYRVIDVDECINGIAVCGIGERCVNTNGGYRCSLACLNGFKPRNNSQFTNDIEENCEDVNECLFGLHTCDILTQYCVNTNGSYICETLNFTTSATNTTATSNRTKASIIDLQYNKVQMLTNDFNIRFHLYIISYGCYK